MPPQKKTVKKKNNVLKDGFFMKGERRFNLHRKFSEKSVAEKVLKNIRAEGYLAELSTYSPKKHKQPYIVFKGPKAMHRGGRSGGGPRGSRKANYQSQYVKERAKLRGLIKDYTDLSVLPEKKHASKMRKLSKYYKTKKKLTPSQKKRANRIKQILKETQDIKAKDFELKVKMKKSKLKIKEIEKKMEESKIKAAKLKSIPKSLSKRKKLYTDEEMERFDRDVAEFGPRPPRRKKNRVEIK